MMSNHLSESMSYIKTVLVISILFLFAGCPADQKADSGFTFSVIGDIHIKDTQSGYFPSIINTLNSLDNAFVVFVGDLIPGYNSPENADLTRKQWDAYTEVMKKLSLPVHAVPGNHDIWDRKSKELYTETVGNLWHSFEYKKSLFIGLSSEEPGMQSRFSDEQMRWLKRELKKADSAAYLFVFVHQPIWRYGSFWKEEVHPLFKQAGVDGVFAGHEHRYEYREEDGIAYIITGGGASNLAGTPMLGGFNHHISVHVAEEEWTLTVNTETGTVPYNSIDGSRLKQAGLVVRSLLPETKIERADIGKKKTVVRKVSNPYAQDLIGTIEFKTHAGSPIKIEPENVKINIPAGTKKEISYQVFVPESAAVNYLLKNTPWAVVDLIVGEKPFMQKKAVQFAFDVWPFKKARAEFSKGLRLPPIEMTDEFKAELTFDFRNPIEDDISIELLNLYSASAWSMVPSKSSLDEIDDQASLPIAVFFSGTPEEFISAPVFKFSVFSDTSNELLYSKVFSLPIDTSNYFKKTKRKLFAAKVDAVEAIDGRIGISDKDSSKNFVYHDGKGIPVSPITINSDYSSDELYISLQCFSTIGYVASATERDSAVQLDDSVEIYIANEGNTYHWTVNADGVLKDEKNGDLSWNSSCRLETLTSKDETEWNVEIAIPLTEILGKGSIPEELRCNFIRNEPQKPYSVSVWNPTFGRFDNPEYYGRLLFQKEAE